MLILWDIDSTLVTTGGAGIHAMLQTGRALHGERFSTDGIPFAGRLDPLIMAEMLVRIGVDPTPAAMAEFRTEYAKRLPVALKERAKEARAMPGTAALVNHLSAHPGVTMGLLTGNFAETGAMKVRACGFNMDHFTINVWGDDSSSTPPTRDDLPLVGIERYERAHSRRLRGHEVTVIGDTPFDVRCAKVHGCRSLAVATGKHPVDELAASGADWAVADLADVPAVLNWLMGQPTRA